jgi:transcriptional repressor NrdR
MRELHGIDPVAYVRFASVYREFQDVTDFMEEVRELSEETPASKPSRKAGRKGR